MPLPEPRAEFVFPGQKKIPGMSLGAVVPFRRPGETFGSDNIAERPNIFRCKMICHVQKRDFRQLDDGADLWCWR